MTVAYMMSSANRKGPTWQAVRPTSKGQGARIDSWWGLGAQTLNEVTQGHQSSTLKLLN